ncbi:unnamed protein product [Parnassius apollo]|uniref:(apollo) hypothetical protein n=1 Tax=Parnassius apollo TaxID=110799 RepID=A0A8S3WT43_PARAO|nr:unnamed protein product [Parnassius apollo]
MCFELWDKRCDAYKNRLMRASAIEALRDGMNKRLTTDEVKAKINSIRNTYYLEIDKIEKSTRSGAGGHIYKPKIIWFDEYDSFVKPVTVRRTTDNTEDSHSVSSHISTHEQGSSSVNTPRSDNGVENESETPQDVRTRYTTIHSSHKKN